MQRLPQVVACRGQEPGLRLGRQFRLLFRRRELDIPLLEFAGPIRDLVLERNIELRKPLFAMLEFVDQRPEGIG